MMHPEAIQKPFYSTLGVATNSSPLEIRNAYRKLALEWHPDRFHRDAAKAKEAKLRFQEIQGAYAVLSDEGKRMLYDFGLYDPDDDEDATQGLSSFIGEMSHIMTEVNAESTETTFEDLQRLFVETFSEDLELQWNANSGRTESNSARHGRKRGTVNGQSLQDDLGFNCSMGGRLSSDFQRRDTTTTAKGKRRKKFKINQLVKGSK